LAEEIIEGWLTDQYDYEGPRRGQLRDGTILHVGTKGIVIDVGLKQEGFVPRRDVDRLSRGAASQLEPGHKVTTYVVNPENRDGNLILSLTKAERERDWVKAEEMLENGELWQGKVTGCNKGGITVGFGRLCGFVPGSHLWAQDKRRVSNDKREDAFRKYVGQELSLKVIEVDRSRRRLILSERLARKQVREQERDRLMDELMEGDVVQGTVTSLRDFGAFVDLGGADGLIHISELAWRRVRHPREVVQVGEELKVYVLKLDHERKRIGLSLKRTQPDPWSYVELKYSDGQLVSGVVTSIADFGAFVALDVGVDGLIHITELADLPPDHPRSIVQRGDELVVRILRIEPYRRRIGLSLKEVSPEERDEWLQAERLKETSTIQSDDGVETAARDTALAEGSSWNEAQETLAVDTLDESSPAVREMA
jgi:small subunit ribosomal protein S1